ncbi:MAG: hypothetical protein KDE56_31090, partial [Anaerolineales bacterium]|nr:hypothetical protein [Anaerolineales bacterium]
MYKIRLSRFNIIADKDSFVWGNGQAKFLPPQPLALEQFVTVAVAPPAEADFVGEPIDGMAPLT